MEAQPLRASRVRLPTSELSRATTAAPATRDNMMMELTLRANVRTYFKLI